MDERVRMVAQWLEGGASVAELSRRYGVSRKTVYKFLERYGAAGVEGLKDKSRRPLSSPQSMPEDVRQALLGVRELHPTWGPKKLREVVRRRHPAWSLPALSTIGELLKREGLIDCSRRRIAKASPWPLASNEAQNANDLWYADFKGWFRTGNGIRCDPLTVSDAASRYLLACRGLHASMSFADVQPVFEATFREYGLPQMIQTDNGSPFASLGVGGLSRLSVWWIKLGITPRRSDPGCPQQNGRHERMHRTLKQETASPPAPTMRAQQRRFDNFVHCYNAERPHEALELAVPASKWSPSQRKFPSQIPPPEYGSEFQPRTVRHRGDIKWGGKAYFLGTALSGEVVACQELENEPSLRIWFYHYWLGDLDVRTGKLRRGEAINDLSRAGKGSPFPAREPDAHELPQNP